MGFPARATRLKQERTSLEGAQGERVLSRSFGRLSGQGSFRGVFCGGAVSAWSSDVQVPAPCLWLQQPRFVFVFVVPASRIPGLRWPDSQ